MSAVLPRAPAATESRAQLPGSSAAPPQPRLPGARTIVIADAAGLPRRQVRTRRLLRRTRVLLPWIVPLALLLLWQYFSASGRLPPGILPAPSAVLRAAWQLAERGELQHDIGVSLRRVAIGFATGAGTGLLLGFLVGMSRLAQGVLDRSLQMLRTIPHLALVPLMILWFGIGEQPRVLLVALGTLFPVYINTMSGIRGVDPKLLELGRSYGLGTPELLFQVVLPAALPAILTGIRYSLGVAWLTLVVGETIASRDGIGYLVQNARELLRTDIILLAIVLYALAGWFADWLIRLMERRLLRWHPSFAEEARR